MARAFANGGLLRLGIGALLLAALLATEARAGGGPETTLVVANAADPSSVRVANAYARLREIPLRHVLYLEGVPASPTIDVDTFRARILGPIEDYLRAEGLEDDVDLIAYSVGFPYAVSFDADAKAKSFQVRPPISRMASLTGLTYLYRHVLAEDPASYLSLTANRYFRRDAAPVAEGTPPLGPDDVARVRTYQGALASKDWAQAAETLEVLLRDFPGVPALWYDLACCRALLGDPDAAMAALEKAVEHGFREADHAERDPDLESLRARPRFAELVAAMREARSEIEVAPTTAFDARKAWDDAGRPVEASDSPHRYRLAVMLGWTGAHGNTTEEVVAALRRARESDGTFPDGTVYFMKNGDVRSTTRAPWFAAVKTALERMGRKAEILEKGAGGQDGTLPRGKFDAIGIVAGRAGLAWRDTDRPLLPGGIGEHLTSFGAHFGTGSQTKCTEFFRHGAAGTSGTVAEPYAIPHKFPSPWMHVHYASGCSLAEAFYQSVWGPYQLLILGDPLARPFAKAANVRIEAPADGAVVKGAVDVEVTIDLPTGVLLDRKELWIDGRRVRTGGKREMLSFDTRTLADGVHEIRVVAIESGPIATRSHARIHVRVEGGSGLELETKAPPEVTVGELLAVEGKARGVETVELLRGAQVLAEAPVKRLRYELTVPALPLGLGTTTLQVRGHGKDGAVFSAPFDVEVVAPIAEVVVGRTLRAGDALPGLRLFWTDAKGEEHEGIVGSLGDGHGQAFGRALAAAGAKDAKRVRLEGLVRVPDGMPTNLSQFFLDAPAAPRLAVGGRDVDLVGLGAKGRRAAFLPLAEGWHALVLEAEGDDLASLSLLLGGVRPRGPLDETDLAHVPDEWIRAENPSTVRLGEEGPPDLVLFDGKRGGEGVAVAAEPGLVVLWEDRQKDVLAVVLHAGRGKDAKPLPATWAVASRSGDRGSWREVKDLEILEGPHYVLLRFKRTSAKGLRITGAAGAVAEVEVFVED